MNTKNIRLANLLIVAGGLLIASRLSFNIWKIWKSGDKIKEAEVRLQQTLNEEIELQKRLAEVQTPEFIEKEARDKLGYGRPGEVIFVLPRAEDQPTKDGNSDSPVWKLWWDLYIRM